MSIDSIGSFPRNATGSPTSFNAQSTSASSDRPKETHGQSPSLTDGSAAAAAEDLLGKAKNTARATAKAVTSQVAELAGNIGSELTQTADEQKGRGADAMRGFAKAVQGAADELDGQSPTVARYIRKAAESVEGLSDTVRTRSVNDLVVTAKETARAHPTAFFVGAVAAGFALSRFFKSSSRAANAGSEEPRNDHDRGRLGTAGEETFLDLGSRS